MSNGVLTANNLKRRCSPPKRDDENVKRPAQTGKKPSLVEMSLGNFATFSKQRLAIDEFTKSRHVWKDDLRIFSYELHGGNGERRYLVTTLQRFCKWYGQQKERHMYELIYEDMPSRLYFDLEYSKAANPGVVQEKAFTHFCSSLTSVLKETYDVTINREKDLLVLESSTTEKFSAHVTCHLPNDLLFPSNVSIRHLCGILKEKLLEDPPFRLKNTDGDKEIPIMDTGVYTKNRNFRLFLSAKLGKTAVLRLAPYCRFYELRGVSKPQDLRIFYDSLCVPAQYHKCPVMAESLFPTPSAISAGISAGTSGSTYCGSGEAKNGQGASPFPHLDDFIVMILKKWRNDVYIHHWKTTETEGKVTTVTYYPNNCRYCFNIGREHKSNGTFWTVDLIKGHFFQKCFDPDCRGRSSNCFPLPPHLLNEVSSASAETADVDESLLETSRIEIKEFFTNWDQVFDQ